MIVGIMVLDMFSESTHSLKEKRHIVTSIREKLRHQFNISIIESDYQNLWQKIQLSIAMVANVKAIIENSFTQIEEFIFQNYPVQIISLDKEYL